LLIGQDLLLPTGYAALISHTPEMTIPRETGVRIEAVSVFCLKTVRNVGRLTPPLLVPNSSLGH